MKPSLARWIRCLLGLGVTVFFLWLLARKVDFAEVGTAISRISLWSLAVAVGFLAADYTVRVIRWWLMLRALDTKVPLSVCGWPFLVSIAVNNLLPFRAGDALRVVGFRSQLRAPAMRLLGTLVIERLLDLMTLLAFFFFGLQGVAGGRVPDAFVRVATWMAAAGAMAVFVILMFSGRLEGLVHWLSGRPLLTARGWSDAFRRHGLSFLGALGVLRAPALTLQLVALSLLVWSLEGAVFATTAHGLSIATALGPWFALATGTLGTLLPSSPGYVGTFDYFAMLGMVAYGAGRDLAAAFAFIVHVVLWLPLTVIGMSYFVLPGARALRRHAAAAVFAQQEARR